MPDQTKPLIVDEKFQALMKNDLNKTNAIFMSGQIPRDIPNEIIKIPPNLDATRMMNTAYFNLLRKMAENVKDVTQGWKKCIVPNCKNKVCLSAEGNEHLCFEHFYYGKPVKMKRIKKDRKKGLVP